MRIDKTNNMHIIADENKVFRRISDGQTFGSEMFLGYTYYIGGVRLNTPLLELPEHYEEIDNPNMDFTDEITTLETEINTY